MPAVEDLFEDMDHIMAESRQVTMDEWKKRGLVRKLLETVLKLFAIWM